MTNTMTEITKEVLFQVMDLLETETVTWWLDGGWGVDVLYGRQTRKHRDIDIDFDAGKTGKILQKLKDTGYIMETDELPVRAELYHPHLGYLDIHPFTIAGDRISQKDPEGGSWVFPPEYFGCAKFAADGYPAYL